MINSQAIVRVSILDVTKGDLALSLLNAEFVLLCDRSGSMLEYAQDNKCRAQIEDEVVEKLQNKHPGKLVICSFSDVTQIHENGVLPYPEGNTNVTGAFKFVESLVEI